MEFRVNGKPRKVHVEPRVTLLDALRVRMGLTGTKRVCDRGACGACTVWVNGKTANACMMLAIDAAGAEITSFTRDVKHLNQAFMDLTQPGVPS